MRLRDFLEIDFSLFFAALLLTVFGILFIYSSGITPAGSISTEYSRQIVWAVAGFIAALVISVLNYRRIYDFSLYLYAGTIVLLIYTCFFGRLVNGARAWIGIGSFGIQPSEFAKISTILFLARHLDSTKHSRNVLNRFVIACVIVFIPMAIVLLQPDFGTSLVFIPILLVMTFISGISMRYIVFLGSCIALTGLMTVLPLWQKTILNNAYPVIMILTNFRFILVSMAALIPIGAIAFFGFSRYKKRYFYWICYGAVLLFSSLFASFVAHRVLKDYQIMRLIVFLDPNVDPRGSGWHIIQSMIAIGSGGFMGKGFLQGTQSHYRFLPQQSTDFIFSIFTEEWGFLGGLLVFALFLLICLRLIRLMRITSDTFGSYIATGLAAVFSFHFMINVGMAMGVMPITGIPLLFMSYGGSALISALIGIGLAMSIHVRRFQRW
ncbi:MAG: rod shape-determining protein RodA [Spirochaetaceae bacterium]|jgi:rod shape determining protein RodA|nr:rod shape-determining protein RodA [Spirochaetaceae bacterium]